MDTELQGTHVFVTGASGGIGLVTAEQFLQEGAKVSLHYNTNDDLERLTEAYPETTCAVRADVASEEEVSAAVAAARERFGTIQVMVVNHGIWIEGDVPLWEMTLERWNRTMAVDLTGAFLCAREFLAQLEGVDHGMRNIALIFVGSTAGKFGEANHADYATAKSGLMYGMTRSVKNEVHKLHPRARVNTVMPGWVRTPMARDALADQTVVDRVVSTVPLKKIAVPEDVAASIVFLASERLSGHLSGQIMEVCGGMEGRVLHY
jgi:NAD(P)-dependent dehydrogenase (short-subunit alcohol dehydrogenase family)